MSLFQCSIDGIPRTQYELDQFRIPLYIVYSPLMTDVPQHDVIPLLRCKECKAYMNPYNEWIIPGRLWKCCFCGHRHDETDPRYNDFKSLNDINNYPELSLCDLQTTTGAGHTRREMQPKCILCALDAALVESTWPVVRETLLKLHEDTHISILIYGDFVTLYRFTPTLTVDIYANPSPTLLPSITPYLQPLKNIQQHLPETLVIPSYSRGSCFGAAMEMAAYILHNTGGQILCFNATHPTLHSGALPPFSSSNDSFMTHHVTFYDDLAIKCSDSQITVNIFASTRAGYDAGLIGDFARRTGGRIYELTGSLELTELLKRIVNSTYYESVFRVRASRNIKTKERYGNYHLRNEDLMAIPCVDPYFAIISEYEIVPSHNFDGFYFQSVFLFTSNTHLTGPKRCLRLTTRKIPFSSNPIPQPIPLSIAANTIAAQIAIRRGLTASERYLHDLVVAPPLSTDTKYYLYTIAASREFIINSTLPVVVRSIQLRSRIGSPHFPVPLIFAVGTETTEQAVELSSTAIRGKIAVIIKAEKIDIGVSSEVEKKIVKQCFGVSGITEISKDAKINDNNPVGKIIVDIIQRFPGRFVNIDTSDKWKDVLVLDALINDKKSFIDYFN
ncbi:Uncharacterized protein QTN25_008954 [Entamoeba marina]